MTSRTITITLSVGEATLLAALMGKTSGKAMRVCVNSLLDDHQGQIGYPSLDTVDGLREEAQEVIHYSDRLYMRLTNRVSRIRSVRTLTYIPSFWDGEEEDDE